MPKRMDLNEFRDAGFLQEVNRQFFHPLGLALEVLVDNGRVMALGGIVDNRDDEFGMEFAEHDPPSLTRAHQVDEERRRHMTARIATWGLPEQPIEGYEAD